MSYREADLFDAVHCSNPLSHLFTVRISHLCASRMNCGSASTSRMPLLSQWCPAPVIRYCGCKSVDSVRGGAKFEW